MKAKLLFFVIVFIFTSFSQITKIERPIINPGYINPVWANDNVVLNNEPAGKFSGVQKSDGKIYVAVNDTISTLNLGIVVFVSSNNGSSWTMNPLGIGYRGFIDNLKLIRTNLDSIYCFYQVNTHVYCWNIISSTVNEIMVGGYRSFDVVSSSTSSIYVFLDTLGTNGIYRYGSINGGYNWYNRGNITSAGANPKVSMSGTGDTLLLNYYGPVLVDTATSIIRLARYRETTPGTLSSAGFIDIATEFIPKYEYVAATNNSEMWFVYTTDTSGVRNIWARKSSNGGTSWEPTALVASNPNFDEYGIDIKFHTFGGYGFDLVYQADSNQVGNPTNTSDKLLYSVANFGSTTFTGLTRVSDYPPAPYTLRYTNSLVNLYTTNDVGVAYVGLNGTNKKLYWDRLLAIVPVELTIFTANANNNTTILQWTTATEKNNKGFFIERKLSTGEFSAVNFINGFGTSSEQHNYSYIDNNLKPGKYFYRLRQVDLDGTATVSNIIEVNISQPVDYNLSQNYPNPFNPSTIINFSIPKAGIVTMNVYDVLGKKVATLINEKKDAGSYSVELNASGFGMSSGVYFYTLEAGSFKSTKKMIMIK
jgi:hypothetical protein